MGPTDILTRVFALYGSYGYFNTRFALYGTEGHFNTRFCLIWDRRTFLHAFLPYMGQTDILTWIFAFYGTDGNFNMRFCLIWDRRTF